jgi:UDP-N-acetylglucosamine--dolichyl-phosphate N-acetylglucosaminephosphotransferase
MLLITNFSIALIISLVTIVSTFIIIKYFIRRFLKKGYTVKDMYKLNKPDIPTMGGFTIIAGIMISIVITQLLVDVIDITRFLVFYMIIIIYGTFGLMDDLIDIGRKIKIFAPYFMALPIALVTTDTNISLLVYTLELGIVYSYLFAPVYIMVVSNLINMHSGYNGLSGGLTFLLLCFVSLKLILDGPLRLLFYIIPLFFSLAAFMWYNKYPSRIFLGNSGTLLIGAGLGALLVFFNMEFFGIIILIPHIINFLFWIFWSGYLMKKYPKKYPHIKFGKIKKDNTIEIPNYLTVKYAITKIFKANENQATWICFAFTGIFGIIGVVFF